MYTPFMSRQPALVRAAALVLLLAAYLTLHFVLYPVMGLFAIHLAAPVIFLVAWQLGVIPCVLFGLLGSLGIGMITRLLDGAGAVFTWTGLTGPIGVLMASGISAAIRALMTERERAYQLLKQTRSIADDGLWDWMVREDTVTYGPRWFTMLGYEPDELPPVYSTFANLLHPDDREGLQRIVDRAVEGQNDQFQTDFRMKAKDGSYRYVLARGRVVERDRQGSALRMIGVHCDISAQKRVEEEIVFYAYHNQLTGLPNRRGFYERLSETIAAARRRETNSSCGVIALDIDDFKAINDMHGQQIADQVIVAFADRLRSSIRETDYLFHLSGDDFCIVLTNLSDDSDAAVVADKIRRKSEEPLVLGEVSVSLQMSMGLAMFPRDGEDASELASGAETALVEAKEERNTYRFYTEAMHSRIVDRVKLIEDLRASIRDERFTVHYQPIVNADRDVVGAEALVRWNHPEHGLQSPDAFVDVAEETGLIVDIGAQVIGRVCADLRKLIDLGHKPVPISVNLSVKQLSTREVIAQIQRALSFHRLSVDLLALEITESSIMESMNTTLSTIEALILIGMRFSIDDFGTGYSSLAYLKRLPIHTVKIDRSFVKGLPTSSKDAAIIRSVIAMADGLGLGLIAEGVETVAQEAFLRNAGCPRMQGYLFSKPVPRDQLEELLGGREPETTETGASRGSSAPGRETGLPGQTRS